MPVVGAAGTHRVSFEGTDGRFGEDAGYFCRNR